MDYVKIMELKNGEIDGMMIIKEAKGRAMEYFKLKMKALPRISFAATYSESATNSDSVTGNNYSMVRYVDSGEVEIILQGREKTMVKSGEYFITPANVPYEYTIRKGSIISMFSCFLDVGVEELIPQEEIQLEHPDNCVYVDIESLFIPIKGTLLPKTRAYLALKQLISEYDRTGEYVNVCTAAYAVEFFIALAMSDLDQNKSATGREENERLYSYCDRIDEYIEKNYSQPITMATISNLLMLHENYISRVYKRIRGESIMQHLLDVRMEKAKKLIMMNRYGIAEIAKMVGFRNSRYFITTFKRIERVTPGKYYDMQLTHRVFTYDPPEFIDPEEDKY